MRLIDFFDRGACMDVERDCLVCDQGRFTYREIGELTCRMAQALRADGFDAGAKIAIYSPNDVGAFVAVFGVFRADGVWVTVNYRNSIEENLVILRNHDAEILFYHSDFEAYMTRIRAEAPGIRRFICVDRVGPDAAYLFDWVKDYSSEPVAMRSGRDTVVRIAATGGTTGQPKGVTQTNLNLEAVIANFLAAMPYDAPPVYLCAAPMTHAAGVTCFPILAAGGTVILMDKPDALKILEAIPLHRVTTTLVPPTLLYGMLAHPRARDFDYGSLRYLIYATAPTSVDKVREAMRVFGPVMTQMYGQTEAPMCIGFLSPRDHVDALAETATEQRLQSCGRAFPLTQVEILDDTGKVLPVGERGEIVVRGNIVMQAYYKNPAATDEVSTFGWHHTGDIGFKDDAGFIYIVDRKKDMIISGGFNVYPAEVERVLLAHEAVQNCAVIGVPDEHWGEAVKAIVQLKRESHLDQHELIAFCKERLGSVKTPKSIEFWDALPQSSVGKVLKREIRRSFWEGLGREI